MAESSTRHPPSERPPPAQAPGLIRETALTARERDEAAALGTRLAEELGTLLRSMPSTARNVRTMAQFLGTDRSTCQRVLAAIKARNEPLLVLLRLPGVAGLQSLVAGARRQGCDPESVQAVETAVSRFASLVSHVGGSHAKLRSRIEATIRAGGDGVASETAAAREAALRRQLHLGAVGLSGKEMDVQVSVSVVRPLPDDGARIERAGVTGFVGQRTRPGATPLAAMLSHSTDAPDGADPSIRYTDLHGSSETLIKEFSTEPLPIVTTRGPSGGLIHMVDPSATQGGNALDVVLGHRMTPVSHPALHENATMNLLARIRSPARRLVFDVFLHRSLAINSLPAVAAYLSLPAPGADTTPRWYERLPGAIELRVLARGPVSAGSDAWASHDALTNHLFEQLRWPVESFVGYRCDVAYPVWGATYMISFEFEQDGEPS